VHLWARWQADPPRAWQGSSHAHQPSCTPAPHNLVCALPSAFAPHPARQIYHYLGGLRHLYWDHASHGNQADKRSPLEVPAMETSSRLLLGASTAATLAAALYST
jgi:hypothetical protein